MSDIKNAELKLACFLALEGWGENKEKEAPVYKSTLFSLKQFMEKRITFTEWDFEERTAQADILYRWCLISNEQPQGENIDERTQGDE